MSKVREALEAAMLRNPGYWRSYYHGDDNEVRISRFYSYSDRCRYYWPDTEVRAEIEVLIHNLDSVVLPLALISQYLPVEYDAIRAGALMPRPFDIIHHHIRIVLKKYSKACGFESQTRKARQTP